MNSSAHQNSVPVSLNSEKLAEMFGSEETRRQRETGGSGARKVLVVGGGGYVGVPVIRFLLDQGFEVRNLDISVYNHEAASLSLFQCAEYEHVRGDMSDSETCEEVLKDIDDLIILAGLVGDPITKAFPNQSARINDDGMTAFLEMLDGRGLNKVIFVSTCSNYGLIGEDELADEEFELTPLSLYAKSKVAAEKKILSMKGKVDFHPTILRFATAFGLSPRMRFDLTVNEFTREMSVGNILEVYDAHTWRPYCHVQDFARLIDRVLRFPVDQVAFEVFNAGGDQNNFTKQGIVDLIKKYLPMALVQYKRDSGDPRNYKVDFSKVRNTLGFVPEYSVERGVVEILQATKAGVFGDIDVRRNFYGNYDLPGLADLPKYQDEPEAVLDLA